MRNIAIVIASIGCSLVVSSPAVAQRREYVARPIGSSAPSFEAPTQRLWAKSLTEAPSGTVRPPRTSLLVAADSTTHSIRTCPMPVLVPDTARLERMRIISRDTLVREPMRMAKPECSNPLRR